MACAQEMLQLVVAGHVDHGKSTVIGRLFCDTNSLPQGSIDRVRRIAGETGKGFEPAYLLDAFEEEQKQGITIDITKRQFHTAKRGYIIIDAPGHKEFLKNMISGATGAEAAFLVIDAGRGVEEQSRRHASMLALLGIRQMAVIVNKMDIVDYSQEVFQNIRMEMEAFLASRNIYAQAFIPVSALLGENIISPSDKLPWYDGGTLVEALDGLSGKNSPDNAPLRFPVQDVYKFDQRRIIAGRIESGRIAVGDTIHISPGGKHTTVLSLEAWPGPEKPWEAFAGECVGITVSDEFFNKRGEIISKADSPPQVTFAFRASIFWMHKTPLQTGKTYRLKLATQTVEAEIGAIFRVMDASTLTTHATGGALGQGREVRLNDVAEARIIVKEPVVLDAFAASEATGRFILQDGYDVAGGGIVIEREAGAGLFSCFARGDIYARCELFEEYYYSVEDQMVNRHRPQGTAYNIGDKIPLEGKSFAYPEFFDIVMFQDGAAVKIRAGEVAEILPLADYRYEGLPLLNDRGFALMVRSRAEWQRCLADFSAGPPDAELTAKWMNFTTYRSIPIAGNDWVI
ncbi:MAG: 50S ribosome-binding GTPase [Deltaproteobacteria bacterium]|jgi:sulfate adenylyltransferase large subunit|nr:50S ribosome-binding GTPase [Deltaproteobacteria bacterium]